MLTKCIDIKHAVKHLHTYVEDYLGAIKELNNTEPFDLKFCKKEFASLIGPPKKLLAKNPNLRQKIETFHNAFIDLSQAHRDEFIKIFKKTNEIEWQLKNPTLAKRLDAYPGGIGEIVHDFFVYLYERTLTKFDLNDHYKSVYMQIKNSWCPFCGMERFISFKRLKQDYDHLLCKSKYPVASVNMMNLVPMGIACNRVYKKTKDLLYKEKVGGRRAIYPYSETIEPNISLTGSILHLDATKRNWIITITPNTDVVHTWNDVFNISERCVEEFFEKLDDANHEPEFDSIVRQFIKMSKDRKESEEDGSQPVDWKMSRLMLELRLFRDGFKTNYYQEYNYVKYAAFDFIRNDPGSEVYRESLLMKINAKD